MIINTRPANASSGGGLADIIRSAAEATGVNFDFLYSQASVESGMNSAAKAKTSSATGLYQFTRSTWLKMVESHGADIGLSNQASTLRSGNAPPSEVQSILDLRMDPNISAQLAARYAVDNARALQARGHQITNSTDLYLAHFLGSNGAATFLDGLKSAPNAPAANALPSAANANPSIFFDNKSARSYAEIYQKLTTRLNNGSQPSQASMAVASLALQQESSLAAAPSFAAKDGAISSFGDLRNLPLPNVQMGGIKTLSQKISPPVVQQGSNIPFIPNPVIRQTTPTVPHPASSPSPAGVPSADTAPPLNVHTLAKFLDTASQWLPDAGALNEQAQKGAISRSATDGLRT